MRSIGFPHRIASAFSNKLRSYQERYTILISGAPRSGTTFFSEVLLTLPKYRDSFEPLNPPNSPRWRKVCYSKFELCSILESAFRPYLRIDEEDSEVCKYLSDVFRGRTLLTNAPAPLAVLVQKGYSLETKINSLMKTLKNIIYPPVVKVVRGNRLLPWIAKRFKLRGIYMIIRHPCATIASQLRTGAGVPKLPPSTLKKLLIYEIYRIAELNQSSEIVKKLDNINTMVEALAAIWALDYYIPLYYRRYGWWYTVVYEKLVLEGMKELKNIFQHINEGVPREATKTLRRYSVTAWVKKEVVEDPRELLGKWKKKLSKKQINNILKVVHWFGLDFYTEDLEPDYDALKDWKP